MFELSLRRLTSVSGGFALGDVPSPQRQVYSHETVSARRALRADKDEYRGLFVALAGFSGKKAIDTDEDGQKKEK